MMIRMRRGVVALAAVALSVSACSSSGSSGTASGSGSGTIKIGVINPFSGPTAPGGIAVTEGYEVAVDQINAAGGVLGKKVELVRGDASTPDQGISEVNRLATSDTVDLFAGTYLSAIANTASETAARYGKLYWETNSLATSLTDRKLTNFVRSGPDSNAFAKVSAEGLEKLVAPSIGKTMSGLKVCISHEQSIYGASVAELQAKLLASAGATVTANVAYDPKSPDLGNVIITCQKGSPDVWLTTGYTADDNLLLRTATQQNFKPAAVMLVGSGDTTETSAAIPDNQLTGVFVTAYEHADAAASYAPGLKDFLTAYNKKYGKEPTFPQTTAAFTGMNMLFDAIKKAGGTDPGAIRKALADIDKPVGSYAAGFGEKFDTTTFQNTQALPTVVQWQSGKIVTVYPDNAKPVGAKVLKVS